MKSQPRTLCSRCIRLYGGPPLAVGWHALCRHGWRHFAEVLFEINARTDPSAFVAALLAAGAGLAVVAYAALGTALHRVVELFT